MLEYLNHRLHGGRLALWGLGFFTIGCIAPSSGGSGAGSPSAAAANVKSCGAEGVVDDGEDGNNQVSDNGGRGGYWYTFLDKVGSSISPKPEQQGGKFAMAQGGRQSQFAVNAKGKVATGEIVYSGVGFNFLDPKSPYDASKYEGISFWAKRGPNSTGKVRLKVPDDKTDPDGKVCSACFNDFGKDLSLTEEWTRYAISFADMRQLSGWGAPHPPRINEKKIYGVQWQVNQPGAAFDISIDDIEFICK